MVALDGKPGALGIQACMRSSAANRITKASAIVELQHWLAAGNRFEVWSWLKRPGVARLELKVETLVLQKKI